MGAVKFVSSPTRVGLLSSFSPSHRLPTHRYFQGMMDRAMTINKKVSGWSGGPGKSFREGIALVELTRMFPDEAPALAWFERVTRPTERCYGHCGSLNTYETKSRKPLPYRCRYCRHYFSVRTGTVMARSHISLQNWAFAIYHQATSLKGVSLMRLHRDLGIGKKTAWFMLHRIRETWRTGIPTFVGPVGKTVVVGIKDRETNAIRADVVERTDSATLQMFVLDHTKSGAKVYTDEARAYKGLPNHKTV